MPIYEGEWIDMYLIYDDWAAELVRIVMDRDDIYSALWDYLGGNFENEWKFWIDQWDMVPQEGAIATHWARNDKKSDNVVIVAYGTIWHEGDKLPDGREVRK